MRVGAIGAPYTPFTRLEEKWVRREVTEVTAADVTEVTAWN